MEVFFGGRCLADRVAVADSFARRLVGLLRSAPLAAGEGLLLTPCSSIHTLGMRFAIDVVLLDEAGVVLGTRERLAPWRIPAPVAGTRMVLELAAGTLAGAGLSPGDRVRFSAGVRLDRQPALR